MCKTSDPDCKLPLGVTEKISCYIEECNATAAEHNIVLWHINDKQDHPIYLPDAPFNFTTVEINSCSKNYSVVADEEINNKTFKCKAYHNITLHSTETVIWVQLYQGMTSL